MTLAETFAKASTLQAEHAALIGQAKQKEHDLGQTLQTLKSLSGRQYSKFVGELGMSVKSALALRKSAETSVANGPANLTEVAENATVTQQQEDTEAQADVAADEGGETVV